MKRSYPYSGQQSQHQPQQQPQVPTASPTPAANSGQSPYTNYGYGNAQSGSAKLTYEQQQQQWHEQWQAYWAATGQSSHQQQPSGATSSSAPPQASTGPPPSAAAQQSYLPIQGRQQQSPQPRSSNASQVAGSGTYFGQYAGANQAPGLQQQPQQQPLPTQQQQQQQQQHSMPQGYPQNVATGWPHHQQPPQPQPQPQQQTQPQQPPSLHYGQYTPQHMPPQSAQQRPPPGYPAPYTGPHAGQHQQQHQPPPPQQQPQLQPQQPYAAQPYMAQPYPQPVQQQAPPPAKRQRFDSQGAYGAGAAAGMGPGTAGGFPGSQMGGPGYASAPQPQGAGLGAGVGTQGPWQGNAAAPGATGLHQAGSMGLGVGGPAVPGMAAAPNVRPGFSGPPPLSSVGQSAGGFGRGAGPPPNARPPVGGGGMGAGSPMATGTGAFSQVPAPQLAPGAPGSGIRVGATYPATSLPPHQPPASLGRPRPPTTAAPAASPSAGGAREFSGPVGVNALPPGTRRGTGFGGSPQAKSQLPRAPQPQAPQAPPPQGRPGSGRQTGGGQSGVHRGSGPPGAQVRGAGPAGSGFANRHASGRTDGPRGGRGSNASIPGGPSSSRAPQTSQSAAFESRHVGGSGASAGTMASAAPPSGPAAQKPASVAARAITAADQPVPPTAKKTFTEFKVTDIVLESLGWKWPLELKAEAEENDASIKVEEATGADGEGDSLSKVKAEDKPGSDSIGDDEPASVAAAEAERQGEGSITSQARKRSEASLGRLRICFAASTPAPPAGAPTGPKADKSKHGERAKTATGGESTKATGNAGSGANDADAAGDEASQPSSAQNNGGGGGGGGVEAEWTPWSRSPPQPSQNRLVLTWGEEIKKRLAIDADAVRSVEVHRAERWVRATIDVKTGTATPTAAVTTNNTAKQPRSAKTQDWVVCKGVLLEVRDKAPSEFSVVTRTALEHAWRYKTTGPSSQGQTTQAATGGGKADDEKVSDEVQKKSEPAETGEIAQTKPEPQSDSNVLAAQTNELDAPSATSVAASSIKKEHGLEDGGEKVDDSVQGAGSRPTNGDQEHGETSQPAVPGTSEPSAPGVPGAYFELPPLHRLLANHEETGEDLQYGGSAGASQMVITLKLAPQTNPAQEHKWLKTGDVEAWLSALSGFQTHHSNRAVTAAAAAAERPWRGKIHVLDPDPPPTMRDVLQRWAEVSYIGSGKDRRAFVRDYILGGEASSSVLAPTASESAAGAEIFDSATSETKTTSNGAEHGRGLAELLCKLIRGERAGIGNLPASGSGGGGGGGGRKAPAADPSQVLVGPLREAYSSSSFGSNQTHVSLGALALFDVAWRFARRSASRVDGGEASDAVAKELRSAMDEILISVPEAMLFKAVDGLWKEVMDMQRAAAKAERRQKNKAVAVTAASAAAAGSGSQASGQAPNGGVGAGASAAAKARPEQEDRKAGSNGGEPAAAAGEGRAIEGAKNVADDAEASAAKAKPSSSEAATADAATREGGADLVEGADAAAAAVGGGGAAREPQPTGDATGEAAAAAAGRGGAASEAGGVPADVMAAAAAAAMDVDVGGARSHAAQAGRAATQVQEAAGGEERAQDIAQEGAQGKGGQEGEGDGDEQGHRERDAKEEEGEQDEREEEEEEDAEGEPDEDSDEGAQDDESVSRRAHGIEGMGPHGGEEGGAAAAQAEDHQDGEDEDMDEEEAA